jgi:two-component system response regulator VicR
MTNMGHAFGFDYRLRNECTVKARNDMKILVADDDRDLVDLIRYSFHREGYSVVTSFDGEMTLRVFQLENPDLVVLDMVMPKRSGLEVLQEIREKTDVPILVLSAQREEDQIVNALYKGADDYMIKPFGQRELRARAKALIRRTLKDTNRRTMQGAPLQMGEITLHPQTREVFGNNKKIHLTRTEFALLMHLMVNHDVVVTFDDLLSNVWGYDGEQNYQVVKVTISRLRRKLADNPSAPRYIVNVPGTGYIFRSFNAES